MIHRFADNDMVMRYHYGLGVGHTYAHPRTSSNSGFNQTDHGGAETHGEELNYDVFESDESCGLHKITTEDELDFDEDSESDDMNYESDGDRSDIMVSGESDDSIYFAIEDMYV